MNEAKHKREDEERRFSQEQYEFLKKCSEEGEEGIKKWNEWRVNITNQRFNLIQPMISVPAIEVALKEPKSGVAKIAAIVIAAENAVKHKLNATILAKLKKNRDSGSPQSDGAGDGKPTQ